MGLPRYSGKEITRHLRQMAMEAAGLTESGEVQTRAEAMALLLWKKALGYTAQELRGEGKDRKLTEVEHPPEAWALQLIYGRLEGKEANASIDEAGKITAAEKVDELAKARINKFAMVGASGRIKMPPPKPPSLKKKDI
jgi:hypothetical protein